MARPARAATVRSRSFGALARSRLNGSKIGGWYATMRSTSRSIDSSRTARVRSTSSMTRRTLGASSGRLRSAAGSSRSPTLSQDSAYSSGATFSSNAVTSPSASAIGCPSIMKGPVPLPPTFDALFPGLGERLRVAPLGVWPTPVDALDGLASELGRKGAPLYVKRDDRSSPVYGGNKVRTLEMFFGEALAQNL